jgi:hypothetical protein
LDRIVNWLRPEDIEGITSREELIEALRIPEEIALETRNFRVKFGFENLSGQ